MANFYEEQLTDILTLIKLREEEIQLQKILLILSPLHDLNREGIFNRVQHVNVVKTQHPNEPKTRVQPIHSYNPNPFSNQRVTMKKRRTKKPIDLNSKEAREYLACWIRKNNPSFKSSE